MLCGGISCRGGSRRNYRVDARAAIAMTHPCKTCLTPIAALFVRRDSIYKTLPGVDCWDDQRDARLWPGGSPMIAHPPCRTWGRLKAFAKAPEDEHAIAPWAIHQARIWGGVVEHPNGSALFRECGIIVGGLPDAWGGIAIEVDQFHWGHKARKRTVLYIVGTLTLPTIPHRPGRPTHVIAQSTGALPWVTHREREATPPEFAEWLVNVARRCRR
jgi:hypothetical protein